MLSSEQLTTVLLANTLGLSILTETLRSASFMFFHSNNGVHEHSQSQKQKLRESYRSFAFVQGTGLDVLLDRYALAYNANLLREAFFKMFHIEGL